MHFAPRTVTVITITGAQILSFHLQTQWSNQVADIGVAEPSGVILAHPIILRHAGTPAKFFFVVELQSEAPW